MMKKIYTPCKDCIYEKIVDRTIYYMKKYHGFDIIKVYFKPADFYVGECNVAYHGVIWCDKPGKDNMKLIDERKIITTTTWLKEHMEKNGVKVEQITPFGVDDELAQKHVNFDFNARRGYISTDNDVLKMFKEKRKQLTLISNSDDADFKLMNIDEDLKYYLLSHSLFYIAINDEITPVEAMSVGTPVIYVKKDTYKEYGCGIEIDNVNDLKKIEVNKEEWEDLSYKCWFKSLRYHYITIGQELWGWLQ
jgi:hypothetical protein